MITIKWKPHRLFLALLTLFSACNAAAQAAAEGNHHGSETFHAFWLEIGRTMDDSDPINQWHLNGWIGGDTHKLWLKSEGSGTDGKLDDAEHWALYSRNVAEFWDFQIGLRQQTDPLARTYAVIGVDGLAPWFVATEAHMFAAEDGALSARLKQGVHLLFTQQLEFEPFYELNLSAREVPELDLGSGLTKAKLGFMLAYEITREIAPYLEISYQRKLGETADLARINGSDTESGSATLGLRIMF